MKGILLAAGRGTRLKPLTDKTPKPLLTVNGKPILSIIMEGLRDVGIDEIALVVGYLGNQIMDFYKDGSDLSIRLEYFTQKECNGTAGAVLAAREFLTDEPFFLGYGDILVAPENYRILMNCFQNHPERSVLSGWPSATPWTGGVLQTDSRDRLVDLIEKPPKELYSELGCDKQDYLKGQAMKSNPGNLINAGLMIVQASILRCIEMVKPSPRGELELTDALLAHAQQTSLHVLTLQNYWSDIGTPDKLREADQIFRDRLY